MLYELQSEFNAVPSDEVEH